MAATGPLRLTLRERMSSRQQKISLLTRTTRGRAAAGSFLASLSEALGEAIEASAFVSLPESDALLEAFRNGYQRAIHGEQVCRRALFRAPEAQHVFQLTDWLGDQTAGERVFLLAKLQADCGAVVVDISTLLRHAASAIRFDGDSLCAMSMDQTQGILIDHNPDDIEQTYEVVVWGDRWSPLARAFRPKDFT